LSLVVNGDTGGRYFIGPGSAQFNGIDSSQLIIPDSIFQDPVIVAAGSIEPFFIFAEGDASPGFRDDHAVQLAVGPGIYQLDGLGTLSVVGDGRELPRPAYGDIQGQVTQRQAGAGPRQGPTVGKTDPFAFQGGKVLGVTTEGGHRDHQRQREKGIFIHKLVFLWSPGLRYPYGIVPNLDFVWD